MNCFSARGATTKAKKFRFIDASRLAPFSFSRHKKKIKKIDLVLLDMVMPNLAGKETYRELKNINPDIKKVEDGLRVAGCGLRVAEESLNLSFFDSEIIGDIGIGIDPGGYPARQGT